MYNVTNPIIIDQSYCDQDKPCKKQVIKDHNKLAIYMHADLRGNIKYILMTDVCLIDYNDRICMYV